MTIGPGGLYRLPPIQHRWSPNCSSRDGARITGLVYHGTMGGFAGAVSWLDNPASHVSAHLVLREDGDLVVQEVPFALKAWHAEEANAHTIGIEMAELSPNTTSANQLNSAARVGAYLCTRYQIPPHWSMNYGGFRAPGITRHLDWGAVGGGHTQCPITDRSMWEYLLARLQHEYARGGFLPLAGPHAWGV